MKTLARLAVAGILAHGAICLLVAATPPGIVWKTKRHETSRMDLNDVASNGAGRLIAVGDNGTIRISDDHGTHWTSAIETSACDLRAVAWAGTRWVAVGGNAYGACLVMTSTDGDDWDDCILGSMPGLYAVASVPGMTAALGEDEATAWSTDLASWTAEAEGSLAFQDVVWTGSQFVAVGQQGLVKTSPDGRAWTTRTSGTTEDLTAVAWNGSTLVAVGFDNAASGPLLMVSANGRDWAKATPPAGSPSVMLTAVAWTGSRFVASGGYGYMFTSADGTTWAHHQVLGGVYVDAFTWDGSRLVGVGRGGLVVTTPEAAPDAAADWTIQVYKDDIESLQGLAIGDVESPTHIGTIRRLVVVGDGGTVLTSDDEGETGIGQTSPVPDNLRDVVATSWSSPRPRFIAVGYNGTIITSNDAAAWTTQSSGTAEHLQAATFFRPLNPSDPSLVIAVGAKGTVLTSDGGTIWNTRTSGTTEGLMGIASGLVEEGKPPAATMRIVAVGLNGTILTSSGGSVWTPRTSNTTNHLYGVAYRGTGFVAVGSYGVVVTSPDGITWTKRSVGTSIYLYDVAWTGSQVVAVGLDGSVFTSPSGISWKRRYTPSSKILNAVCALDSGRLMAAGDDGLVITSDPAPDFADWIGPQSPPSGQGDPGDDPNHDGIVNLLAYGFGIPAVAPTTPADRSALPLLVQPTPGRRLLVRLRPNHGDFGDLTYVVEQSSTLQAGGWTEMLRRCPGQTFPSGSLNLMQSAGSEYAMVEFQETIGSQPPSFVRMRVELNNPP